MCQPETHYITSLSAAVAHFRQAELLQEAKNEHLIREANAGKPGLGQCIATLFAGRLNLVKSCARHAIEGKEPTTQTL